MNNCVISFNEKGFWQADVFVDDSESGECFCTGSKGADEYQVINKVNKTFKGDVEFMKGLSGICHDCGTEFMFHESDCECGGEVESFC